MGLGLGFALGLGLGLGPIHPVLTQEVAHPLCLVLGVAADN